MRHTIAIIGRMLWRPPFGRALPDVAAHRQQKVASACDGSLLAMPPWRTSRPSLGNSGQLLENAAASAGLFAVWPTGKTALWEETCACPARAASSCGTTAAVCFAHGRSR